MSLHDYPIGPVPEESTRVAHAAFALLFAVRGQPAEALGRLALVTILQYAEGLSDRQAIDAVHSRIDWNDALGVRAD